MTEQERKKQHRIARLAFVLWEEVVSKEFDIEPCPDPNCTPEQARVELREMGLDPNEVLRTMREKLF